MLLQTCGVPYPQDYYLEVTDTMTTPVVAKTAFSAQCNAAINVPAFTSLCLGSVYPDITISPTPPAGAVDVNTATGAVKFSSCGQWTITASAKVLACL